MDGWFVCLCLCLHSCVLSSRSVISSPVRVLQVLLYFVYCSTTVTLLPCDQEWDQHKASVQWCDGPCPLTLLVLRPTYVRSTLFNLFCQFLCLSVLLLINLQLLQTNKGYVPNEYCSSFISLRNFHR